MNKEIRGCILNGVIEDILPDTSEKELAGIILRRERL